jgi:hypothetical protein
MNLSWTSSDSRTSFNIVTTGWRRMWVRWAENREGPDDSEPSNGSVIQDIYLTNNNFFVSV